jgi:hypothetical protein
VGVSQRVANHIAKPFAHCDLDEHRKDRRTADSAPENVSGCRRYREGRDGLLFYDIGQRLIGMP